MRIYELARELGVASAEVVKAASAAGIEASSAISVVEDGEAASLREALKG
ncbi:MAG: translation initiation factor IF-2 N-terminal domain-containing protein, partial [Kiritimatiellae bacterium]|nr:translation initiation factor IF-2 N-terminal domain-containing protein [Kiritimatiellia bacterium]